MTNAGTHFVRPTLALFVLLWMGCASLQGRDAPPEGTWTCSAEWSEEKNGIEVIRSVKQQFSCVQNEMSSTGVISIGSAQWSEKKQGTCYASGDELYGEWTAAETIPKNDAARQFERQRLAGESLAKASQAAPTKYRVRVTSRTETHLQAVNPTGQIISCTRL